MALEGADFLQVFHYFRDAGQSDVDSELRIRFFRAAQRTIPARVPVNVVLFPMSGDPAAPGLFWTLAINTRGSFVSPSRDWPDT